MALLSSKKPITQARGRARRQALLEAARQILATAELDSISLGDVARQAQVPKGSAYHFFNDIGELYMELVHVIGGELRASLGQPLPDDITRWEDIVAICIERGVAYYEADPAARQLLVGPKTPPDIKRCDRANDIDLGMALESQIARHFELPDLPERSTLFFRAIEIADLMFCLSMMDHGRVTPALAREACRAATAYLKLYIPEHLPRRQPGEQEP